MNDINDELYIKRCIRLIEERLGWGPAQNWVNYDFEKLSSAIEDKTHVVLSVTTLKRIWGKVKYDHSPTLTTLNTLAKFLDFEDWRSFTNTITNNEKQISLQQTEMAVEENVAEPKKKRRLAIPVSLMSIVLLLSATLIIFSAKKDPAANHTDATKFQFKADKIISEGVPNSVIFSYDASAAKTDSVYIVQTWDIRRKTPVSKNNNRHSAIYYYPGFFRTKLIAAGEVVKTYDLQIASKGWLCLAEKEPVPLYFKKEECEKNDRIEVDKDVLKRYNLSLNPEPPKIRFFNQRDLGDLMNDNFTFETTLKNEFSAGSNACQYVEVLIQCKDDIIIIPLAAKACTGAMHLYACGTELKSKEADLSGFGADLTHWVTLRVETKNKKMNFFVNNTPAASFVFPNNPCGIVGVQYRFNGVGAVRDTWFGNASGKRVMN